MICKRLKLLVLFCTSSVFGVNEPDLATIQKEFSGEIQPLVKQYCLGCHSTEKQKGDLDLERFSSFTEISKHPKVWENVIEQVSLGEMPPKEKPQPKPAERERLLQWVNGALNQVALARAGDPGPVVLRRLNNAEYTYTIRDLTGVETLNPAREFPGDSAAGEGFMNTGNSLVMSPALLTKYLDAGKTIASHAVLVPDGFRFSEKTSRRDWGEEILADIRQLYREYTDPQAGGEKVNLQGIIFNTNEGGRLPLESYFRVLLTEGEALKKGKTSFAAVAKEHHLSAKYLQSLWDLLHGSKPSLLLGPVRDRWASASPEDAGILVSQVTPWQKALWKFSSVGHIGKVGGPKAWMEPVSPLTTRQDLRLKLTAPTNASEVVVYMVATDAGDGNANDFLIWERPRLVAPGRPEIQLRDAREVVDELTARRDRFMAATAPCLAAAAEAGATSDPVDVTELAKRHNVDSDALTAWLNYLGIGSSGPLTLDHFEKTIERSAGYDFVKGWGVEATPHLVANSSDQHVRIPGNMKPHGVAVHPTPKLNVGAGWQSPIAGMLRVSGQVTHAHPECGNGVEWFVEVRRGQVRQRIAKGIAVGAKNAKFGPIENLPVKIGDLVSLIIGPRDANHSCDLTDIELDITGAGDEKREWSLTRDVSPDILAANPHPDRFGNPGVWHFYTEPVSGADLGPIVPPGSLLARWQATTNQSEQADLAGQVQKLLMAEAPSTGDAPNAALYRQVRSLGGPLLSGTSDKARKASPSGSNWSLDPRLFGKIPGSEIESASLCVQAPSVVEIRLPADLAEGAELVTGAKLHSSLGAEGSVQVLLTMAKPEQTSGLVAGETRVVNTGGQWTSQGKQVSHSTPIIVSEKSAARERIEANFDEFRQWFPAALCYSKIVPVDEVVTLTLFHREDDHLARLMLDEKEKARLNRLWNEFHYVSQDALMLVDVLEQIWQYATQDADPTVFEPMRKPTAERAEAFRRWLVETEPKQVETVVDFAGRAYRRPLTGDEKEELRSLYRKLREQEIPHEEAFRMMLSRIFVAPAFLYRLEKAAPAAEPAPVTDWELASRLSYFLWSSEPDAELREQAAAGRLHEPEVLVAQTRRMLREARVRRLATEFGCAWLHVHDFGALDEKSERHFPTFTSLREDMYEETIQFFTDLFKNDRSVLNILNADYMFVNGALAKHYGIPDVTGPEWRRIEGVRNHSRGGILALASTLAKQSGASRTSPILRGIWVSEVLLGEKLPKPPKGVPVLPEDEATESLTVRQLVEKHSSDAACAKCHVRIDGYGFALEGYDAIGRARSADLGGRPIDTRTTVFDGTSLEGMDGLREYLLSKKRDVVVQQFCRKLLGYALGRGVLLSDKPLIAEMQQTLAAQNYRFSAAVEQIVMSKQFREIRGKDQPTEN